LTFNIVCFKHMFSRFYPAKYSIGSAAYIVLIRLSV
jgi:hypothetical protein